MTDTELKLQDAAAQMRLALKHIEDDDTLRSCINSFISHGRSVTFVMQAESSEYPSLIAWYKAQMDVLSKVALMRFFNEKRVHTIHRGVIKPSKIVKPISNLKVNGVPMPGPGTMTVWIFDGIAEYVPADSGNVFRLCEQYFLILKAFVADWLLKRKEMSCDSVA